MHPCRCLRCLGRAQGGHPATMGGQQASRPTWVKIAVSRWIKFLLGILTCLVIPLFILFLMKISFKCSGWF